MILDSKIKNKKKITPSILPFMLEQLITSFRRKKFDDHLETFLFPPRVQSSPIIAKSGTVHLSTFRHSELQLKARKSIAAGIYSGNCARRGGMQREFEIDRRYESAKE